MKKINLLVALTLSLNVFSQEMKKDTTHKEIKKSEKVKTYTGPIFTSVIIYLPTKQEHGRRCTGVSKKGVRCSEFIFDGSSYCKTRMCLGDK